MPATAPQPDGLHPSICRLCLSYCPIEVEVRDGKPVSVRGDATGTPWNGFLCPKGRALPEQHTAADRLLHPLRRTASDTFEPAASADIITEIADRLHSIIDAHGPQSVALYIGTGVVSNPTMQWPVAAFMRALGSPMVFSAATIDKPGANVAQALHGLWQAGGYRMEDCDAWLVVGGNPVIARSNGAPPNNPGLRLKEAAARGMALIVIDPRRTETARRARHHLRVRPGQDAVLLAGMLRVILAEGLEDRAFLAAHAQGLDALREAVSPFDLGLVEARTGVPAAQIAAAARDFAQARRAGAVCSTGPSFAPHGTLCFYLALCLNTVCGHWPREGEQAPFPNLLLPTFTPRAQAWAPYPAVGAFRLSATGLPLNASGLPTAGLPDQILTDGPDPIRALLCIGGNPVLSWPDQRTTERALSALDLLVVSDFRLTATAELADFVVPPPLTLEIPGNTQMIEWLKYIGVTRGMSIPWAQATPALVAPPEGADLLDEGSFLFLLAQRMGLALTLTFASGLGPHAEVPLRSVLLDMSGPPPSIETIYDLACAGSRVALGQVRQQPRGALHDLSHVTIEGPLPEADTRMELADPMMLSDLGAVLRETGSTAPGEVLLTCRRVNSYMNSVGQGLAALGEPVNPLAMHPDDIAALELTGAGRVRVEGRHGTLICALSADNTVLPGTASLSHGFGGRLASAGGAGASVAQLVGMDERDPVTGMPRMTAIPVRVVTAA